MREIGTMSWAENRVEPDKDGEEGFKVCHLGDTLHSHPGSAVDRPLSCRFTLDILSRTVIGNSWAT